MATKIKILETFSTYATEHGKAIDVGNSREANKLHSKLHDVYRKVKKLEMLDVFLERLNDTNDSIKLWAAIFTLKTNSATAIRALQEVSQSPMIIGLTAKTTLSLWTEGKLDLL